HKSSLYHLFCYLHPFLTVFSLILRRPPRYTLFPYTTLFRSYLDTLKKDMMALMARQDEILPKLSDDSIIENEIREELLFIKNKRSEEHTSELQSRFDLVCRLLLEKKKKIQ